LNSTCEELPPATETNGSDEVSSEFLNSVRIRPPSPCLLPTHGFESAVGSVIAVLTMDQI